MSVEIERIKLKFRPVFREIQSLDRKIYKKKGWIFRRHVHTVEELLNSEHHRKIDSYTNKIGDDIQHWFDAGKLSDVEYEIYLLKREEVEDELDHIHTKIEEREPTWWEEVKDVMQTFVIKVMYNMPEKFRRTLLSYFNNKVNKLIKHIFSSPKKLPKL